MAKLDIAIARSVLLTGLAIGLMTQATAQESKRSASDQAAQSQIEALVGKYEAAFNRKDAAGVAALYAKDGVLMVSLPNNPVSSGRQAIEKMYEGAFKSGVSDLHGKVDEAHATGGVAWARGSFTEMRPAMAQGGAPEHVRGMFGGVYERQGGEYKIRQLTVFFLPSAPAQPAVGSTTPPASEGKSAK